MRPAARQGFEALASCAVPDQMLGERLSTYLKDAKGAFSDNTERAIRSDVEIFADWCEARGLSVLPARTDALVAYIDAMAKVRAPATVRRYVFSIATVHKAVGLHNPLKRTGVKLALQRMHRKKGRRQEQVQGLTWPLRERMIEACGERLIDDRNRALLAVAYDTLLRRSELVALEVSDLLAEVDGSGTVLVQRGKTDPNGEGALLYLAPDTLRLVKAWLSRSGLSRGRLFRSIRKSGQLGARLDDSQVPRIFKGMAKAAGLGDDVVEGLSGHSARVGATQDMIASGIELPAILQAGRWKSTSMVYRYGERLLAKRSGAAKLAELQQRS
ncbi:MAG: site-specific integrase [Proteobacteria bacterium]|nr:site-specific integrase [Pseudomonadota bacterium]